MKQNDDIEDLFKKSFENYEPEVRPTVWKNIRVGLKWGSLAFFINALINKIGTTAIIIAVSSAAAIIGVISFMNWNAYKKQEAALETPATTIYQTPAIKDKEPVSITENNAAENPESSSNAEIKPVKEAVEKTEAGKNIIIDESVASIAANQISGTAPLIIDFSNTGSGKTNKWIFSDNKNAIAVSNPVHIFETAGTYSVRLSSTDASGKTDTDTITVEVTGNAPAAIELSPDGDGVNDAFKFDIQKIVSMSSKIFDKNGITVYKSESAGAWDGKDLQGREAAQGTYFYTVHAEGANGKKYDKKGLINLKR